MFDTRGVSCFPGIPLRTREQFLSCVDSSLKNAKSNSVVQLFRPLFNVSIVAEAYNDLCNNLTGTYNLSGRYNHCNTHG